MFGPTVILGVILGVIGAVLGGIIGCIPSYDVFPGNAGIGYFFTYCIGGIIIGCAIDSIGGNNTAALVRIIIVCISGGIIAIGATLGGFLGGGIAYVISHYTNHGVYGGFAGVFGGVLAPKIADVISDYIGGGIVGGIGGGIGGVIFGGICGVYIARNTSSTDGIITCIIAGSTAGAVACAIASFGVAIIGVIAINVGISALLIAHALRSRSRTKINEMNIYITAEEVFKNMRGFRKEDDTVYFEL